MANEYNIIGDIAGQFKTLQALLAKMPEGTPVSVGDLIDRGDKSKEVLDFFMENGRAVLGNHENMMLDELAYIKSVRDGTEYHKYYEPGLWFQTWRDYHGRLRSNGGLATIKSFGNLKVEDETVCSDDIYGIIPRRYIKWLENLPLYIQEDGLFISHAPKRPDWTIERACVLGDGFYRPSGKYKDIDSSIIWNRGNPRRMKDHFQVFGHQAALTHWKWKDKEGWYAINLDSSRGKKLTGIHWPTMEIFEQDYID